MAYARVDINNRIVEWSDDKLDGFDVEFYNGDYIHVNERNGVKDFVIRNGEAVFEPTDESTAEWEERQAAEHLPEIVNDIQDGLIEVADIAADNKVSNAEIVDAVIELAGIVAGMMEGAENG